ncbi:MAG: RluA family pseudouridine synthase [Saprospiraceae bacterium]
MNNFPDHILVNNHHYVAFNKPGGMAVQSVHQKEQSLEVLLFHYCKANLFLIHRIDQPCSGVVLFAKKKTSAAYFSELIKSQNIERRYLALVSNKPLKDMDTLSHFLFAHKKSNKSFEVDETHKEGKKAILEYVFCGTLPNGNHLLEIKLETGRHHQIRAQLAAIGSPIIGDIKYGSKESRSDNSIALHAYSLDFIHPVDQTNVKIIAPVPDIEIWKNAQSISEGLKLK